MFFNICLLKSGEQVLRLACKKRKENVSCLKCLYCKQPKFFTLIATTAVFFINFKTKKPSSYMHCFKIRYGYTLVVCRRTLLISIWRTRCVSVLLCHHHCDDTAEAPQKLELEDVTMTFRTVFLLFLITHRIWKCYKSFKKEFCSRFLFPFF